MASQDNTPVAQVDTPVQQATSVATTSPPPPPPYPVYVPPTNRTWQPVERQIRSCYWVGAYDELASLPAGQEHTTTVYSRPDEWTYKLTRNTDDTYTVQKYYAGVFKYSHPYDPKMV